MDDPWYNTHVYIFYAFTVKMFSSSVYMCVVRQFRWSACARPAAGSVSNIPHVHDVGNYCYYDERTISNGLRTALHTAATYLQ